MYTGISEQEARERIEQYGPNELGDENYRTLLIILLGALKEPTVILLLGIGTIYAYLGEKEEVISLLSFLVLILSITVIQEYKTEKTLKSLKRLSSPRAIVVRDGKQKNIPGREIVPGDLIFLSEGDRVPADIILQEGRPLSIDESILTGESFPVEKSSKKSGDNKILSGSLIIKGQAWGEVIETGENTEIGKIGTSLKNEMTQPTPLQKQARKAVNKLGKASFILTVFIIVIYGLMNNEWPQAMLVGLTLAMAIIPNELPAVLLIFLASGAWRISKRQVLTRKIPAIEALGSITVLCVDKTGTLTQNSMELSSFCGEGFEIDMTKNGNQLPENFHELLEFGILASHPRPFDPMEKAFHYAGKTYLDKTEHLHPQWILTREYPLTEELLAVTYAWEQSPNKEYKIAAKGAPEAIINLCHLKHQQKEDIEKQVEKMARKALRVIGIAKTQAKELPHLQHDLNFQFIGLVGFADPIRSDVCDSVRECQEAGIKVIMITGDHPITAQSIGQKIGLTNSRDILTGTEIDNMDDSSLSRRIKEVSIFCRMHPLQKLRIVKILQAASEVVAMTGDGVNDAPALKSANVGIAMGERGTDVAREAASVVLLDDNFSSIVAAIKMGRRTFQNLQDAFCYLLAIHIPIIVISVIPVFFKSPIILLPVHIALLHLIIGPVSTIFFEGKAASTDLMKRPPRNSNQFFMSKEKMVSSFAKGIWISIVVASVFFFSSWRNDISSDVRGLTFVTLIFSNLALIYYDLNRPRSLIMITILTLLSLAIIIYVPELRSIFRIEFMHAIDLTLCLISGLITIIGLSIWRRIHCIGQWHFEKSKSGLKDKNEINKQRRFS